MPRMRARRSETTTSATTLSSGRVGRDRGDVLNAANLDTRAGEGAESGLSTRTGGLGTGTTSGTDLEVEGVDANLLAAGSNVLGGKHGGVGRRLVVVGLDLHTTSDTRDGLTAREIGDVDESIVERGKDAGNAKDKLALAGLQAKGNVL